MGLTFLHPWQLLLALPAGALVLLLALKSRSGLDPFRLWLATAVRLAVVLALVSALAQIQFVREKDDLAVAFLLDCSQSVPAAAQQQAIERINAACKPMKGKEVAALIPFGAEPVMETSFRNRLALGPVASVLQTGQTDLASALRLAAAAFPAGTQRRIVLISDGNENAGNALEEAAQLKAHGIALDVLPLDYAYPNEVVMESLLVPSEANRDEALEAKIVVQSLRETDATLSFYQNRQLVARQVVHLQKGKNVLTVPRRLSGDPDQPNRAGFYTFEAYVDAPGDQLAENNRAHAFTLVQGEARVLLIEAGQHAERFLLAALAQEGFAVDCCTPVTLPGGMSEIQAYDAVILSNVAADQLPRDVLEGIPSAVRDLGVGLVMIGGEDAFGAGGYYQTGLEEVLPVSMDLTQRKVVPNGALVLILHTCEIPDALSWEKPMARAALDALSPQDWFGELDFGPGTDRWGIPLQKVGDKGALKAKIKALTPMDMPAFSNIFLMAHQGLKQKHLNASVKHCIVISDGDPAPPTQAQIQAMVDDKITVSTVGIGPHGGGELAALATIAKWGKGRFYNVTDPKKLPQIFSKEAQVVRRALLCEETFLPKVRRQSDLMRGVPQGVPPLHGYVCTTPKDRAELPIVSHLGDPILAHWRIGLGKSVAFTSDAKNAWGRDWVAWGDYRRFWAQTLRWVMRSTPRSRYQVQTEIREGKGHVLVDALDPEGRFVNDLHIEGRVSDPARNGQPLPFSQTGPGRYEATFDARDPGAYYLSFGYRGEKGDQGIVTTGTAVSYSPEFRALETNHPLLSRLAEAGKGLGEGSGRILPGLDGVFEHNLPKPKASTDLWPWMLQIAVWGFFGDIVFRRVLVSRRDVQAGTRRLMSLLPAVGARFRTRPPTREETLASLLARKAELQTRQEAARYEASAGDLAAGQALAEQEGAEAKASPPVLSPNLPPSPTLGGTEAPKSYTERLLEAKRKALEEERKKRI
jgi:uncharacterized membrane protein